MTETVLTPTDRFGNDSGMNLTEYALGRGGTGTLKCPELESIATAAGCSRETLYLIAKGHKQCGPKLANRIEVATNGEVTRFDLRADLFGPAPDQREAA